MQSAEKSIPQVASQVHWSKVLVRAILVQPPLDLSPRVVWVVQPRVRRASHHPCLAKNMIHVGNILLSPSVLVVVIVRDGGVAGEVVPMPL